MPEKDRVYGTEGGELFFLAQFALVMLPSLLCMILMMLFKNVLPFFLPWAVQGLCAVGTFIVLGAASLKLRQVSEAENGVMQNVFSETRRIFLSGGGWALAVLLTGCFFRQLAAAFFDELLTGWADLLFWLLFALAECLAAALFAERALRPCETGVRAGKWLIAALTLFGAYMALPALPEMIPALETVISASFMRYAVYMVLLLLVQWLLCWPVFCRLCAPADGGSPAIDSPKGNGLAALIVAAMLFTACFFVQLPRSEEKTVLVQIHSMTEEGDKALAQGDLLAAASCYESVQRRKDAWLAAVTENNISYDAYGDAAVKLLAAEDYFQEDEFYADLLYGDAPDEYYIYYLSEIKQLRKEEPENEKMAAWQSEILRYCALHGIWTGKAVLLEKIGDRQKQNLIDQLTVYQAQLDARSIVCIYRDLMVNGGVLTLEMVERAVALAEQYPDSLFLQGAAMEMAAGFSSDLAGNCYEQGIAAAKRYDKLYRQLKPDASGEEKAVEAVLVANVLMRCLDLEGAKTFLENALREYQSEELWHAYAGCLYRLKEYADCVTVTTALYDAYENQSALGLRMLAQLLQEDNEQSLTLALTDAMTLSRYAQETGDIAVADSVLFTLSQALAGTNVSDRRLEQNRYSRFTEEELALLAEDPLLESMVKACYSWQDREYEEALSEVNKALNMAPDWSNLHYLKGSILFELGDHEMAKNSYMISLECNRDNAATWFMLGHCYDRLKEYDLSANAFRISNQLLPNSEHDLDYYGIGLHAERAFEELQDYIDKEVRR